jgi:LacI family transcriptional regulator
MVTIRELSARCGLSISAVSKALNNYPDISAKTREHVQRTAGEMGYVPNAMARALKTNRSFNIGVLLDDEDHHGLLHHFFVPVLESFRTGVEGRGYDLTLMNHNVGSSKISYLEHYRYRNLDGVFVACMDFEDPELLELASSDIPLVTIDHPYEDRAVVFSDNLNGIIAAVRYAAQAGHTRIAYINGAPSDVTAKRIQGYLAAMEELKLPIPTGYLVQSRYRDIPLTHRVTAELLKLIEPPTCILMPDDYAALGGVAAIREAGLSVPQDVSVIGYDGMEILKYWEPRLTTIKQDTDALGKHAAELLLEQMEKRSQTHENKSVTVPAAFVEGMSVAAPPRAALNTDPYSVLPPAKRARG